MVSLCQLRKPNTPQNRIQKRQHKVKHSSPLKLSRSSPATALSRISELNNYAMLPAPLISGGRQDSCSFRTRLFDDECNDDLDDITYAQPTTPLGRDLPGNPYLPPSNILFPETPTISESTIITEIHPTTKSGPNDNPTNFSFLTVEEFSDTVMVDPLQDENKENAPTTTTTTNNNNNNNNNNSSSSSNSRKRKSFSSIHPLSLPRKRVAKTAITIRNKRLSQQCQSNDSGVDMSEEVEDISDDWSFITDVDVANIPTYGPSAIMELTQSVQAILLRRAMAKARQARRKMRTLERSCRTLFRSAFDYPGHAGPTKCISVGGGSW